MFHIFHRRLFTAILSLSTALMLNGFCEPTSASDQGPPQLTLEGANGENHCTLDFTTSVRNFKGNDHCENDQAVGIEFEHVPSASNILVFDDYTCDRTDSGNYFWFYLRTIKENLTTDGPIDLNVIASTPTGRPVAPGILLISRYQKPGETMKKRASCVKIEVDAPPLPVDGP